jgi:translocation and assembly module TamA
MVQKCGKSAVLLLMGVVFLTSCAHQNHKICNHIEMREGTLSLNSNEKVMVCGSEKDQAGWNEIPIPQAQHQLSVYLNNEGYLSPRFQREKNQLLVWSGPRSEIAALEVTGAEGLLDPNKKRKIVGEPLVPARLDDVQQWAETELRNSGYACPRVSLQGQAWDNKLVAKVETGQRQTIGNISRLGLEGIDQSYLSRYEAFASGDVYDVRETQLTVSRMLADGFIQSANFVATCRGDKADLTLRASIGPPKVFRFEVGASTEEFPFASVTFRNARVDDRASSFTATLYTSPRTQSITGTSQLYWLPWTKKAFFGPRARLGRVSEKTFEYLEAKVGADIGRFLDMWDVRFIGRLGPTVNYTETKVGIGPENISYLSWEGSLEATSHTYESNLRNQYEGWSGSFHYRGQKKGLGSQIDVNRYDATYKNLWNIASYAPPLLVLGFRFEVNAVDADQAVPGQDNRELVPIDYRVFYGGAENLRGFSRKSITNGNAGFLTAAYAGFELRLIEELAYNIQPLVLVDLARLGTESMTLDDPLFTSLGAGVRWASPFGTLRGSAARGKIYQENLSTAGYAQEWVYFVSFGQEF